MVQLERVQRIETEGRFVEGPAGQSPTTGPEPVVVEGDELEALVQAAQCHAGPVLWKGGIPATLVLRDGTRVDADGFSFYGRFLRIHRNQWCELTPEAWDAVWTAEPE